jgi:hypothetical protein
MNSTTFSSQHIGAKIESAAYAIAPFIAAAIVAAQLTYGAGRDLRLMIERWNDQLATWWVAALGLAPAPAPAPLALAPAPVVTVIESAPEFAPKHRKPRTKKAAVAAPPAPPAPPAAPAAPAPRRPRPAKRARKAPVEPLAA